VQRHSDSVGRERCSVLRCARLAYACVTDATVHGDATHSGEIGCKARDIDRGIQPSLRMVCARAGLLAERTSQVRGAELGRAILVRGSLARIGDPTPYRLVVIRYNV